VKKRVKGKKLGRNAAQRKALYRGLFVSLIRHGTIETTLAKAKAARPPMEKLITIARKGDLTARRRLLAAIPQKEMVEKMIDEIGPRFRNRPGGYLRIVKLGPRPSDQTEMARLEFVEEEEKSKDERAKSEN
jgi:large subunit ribosomal protein L17